MELLVTIIILALIFDYINGFHDAANSIATIVSTRVLTPFQAVLWAAFFNFVAFFIAKYIIGGFGIANTVSKTVVEQYITLPIILAGVIAAITWNLITWWKGIPSSSSHTHPKNCSIYFFGSFYWHGHCIRIHFVRTLYLPASSSSYRRAMVQEITTCILRPFQCRTWSE